MIRYYFTKALQVSQFSWFHKIIIGIHKDEIPAHNASKRAFIEEWKPKLKKDKEEYQEAAKLSVD